MVQELSRGCLTSLLTLRQVRCSGDRPICKRCARLNHTCHYGGNASETGKRPTRTRRTYNVTDSPVVQCESATSSEKNRHVLHSKRQATNVLPSNSISEVHQLGIPSSLVSILVELYYSHVYNASLLLQKRCFLEAMADGSVSPHVILSVCAWGSM